MTLLRFSVILLLMALLVVSGCQDPNPVNPDIQHRELTNSPGGEIFEIEDPPLSDSPRTTLLIRRLKLPLNPSVESIWQVADPDVISPIAQLIWNGNGLRVAKLTPDRRSDFTDSVVGVLAVADQKLTVSDQLTSLRQSPPLQAEFFADLTRPGGAAVREPIQRGRLQMLISTRPLAAGGIQVTLIPQHHRLGVSLLPRSAAEKELAGRVFDELAIDVGLAAGDILLLGYASPASTVEDVENFTEDAPLNLGRGLFTTRDDAQMMLMIRAE
jgi:hypothetical protein